LVASLAANGFLFFGKSAGDLKTENSELRAKLTEFQNLQTEEISKRAAENFGEISEKLKSENSDRAEISGEIWVREKNGGRLTLKIGENFWSKIGAGVPTFLVSDSSCGPCTDLSKHREQIETQFPFAEIKIVDLKNEKPPAGTTAVPMIIFSPAIKNLPDFAAMKNYFQEIDGGFEFDPGNLRISNSKKILDSEKIPRARENGRVKIVEYSEFLCPYCKRFDEETLPKLREKYGEKVSIEFRHFLVHGKPAEDAATASECAREISGDEKFWEMHDLLFENQQNLSAAKFTEFAAKLELPADEFQKCFDGETVREKVRAQSENAKKFGVRGTPGIFVDEFFFAGALPAESFFEIIDAKLD